MSYARRRTLTGQALKWKVIIMRDPCSYCMDNPSMTVDHIFPRSKIDAPKTLPFSPNNWQNLAPACKKCNEKKDNEFLLLFLVKRFNHELRQHRQPI